jgi:hypothetical protein
MRTEEGFEVALVFNRERYYPLLRGNVRVWQFRFDIAVPENARRPDIVTLHVGERRKGAYAHVVSGNPLPRE